MQAPKRANQLRYPAISRHPLQPEPTLHKLLRRGMWNVQPARFTMATLDEKQPTGPVCPTCGRPWQAPLGKSAARHRWQLPQGVFAARLETDDFHDVFADGVVVESYVRALLLCDGAVIKELPAGAYTLKELGSVDLSPKRGVRALSVLVANAYDEELKSVSKEIITNDDFALTVVMRWRVRLSDPHLFFVNVMRNLRSFDNGQLTDRYQAQFEDAVKGAIAEYPLDRLKPSKDLKAELSDVIERCLRVSLVNDGLYFIDIKTLEWSNPELDLLADEERAGRLAVMVETARRRRAQAARLNQLEAEAKTIKLDDRESALELERLRNRLANARQRRRLEGDNELDALEWELEHQLAVLKARVDAETRTAPLRERRMRQLEVYRESLRQAQVKQIVADVDLRKFINQMEHEVKKHELFTAEEFDEIAAEFRINQADRNAKAQTAVFLEKKLALQQERELAAMELERDHGLTMMTLQQSKDQRQTSLRDEYDLLQEVSRRKWAHRKQEAINELELQEQEAIAKQKIANLQTTLHRANTIKTAIANLQLALRKAKTDAEIREIQSKIDLQEFLDSQVMLDVMTARRLSKDAARRLTEFEDYQRKVRFDLERRERELDLRIREAKEMAQLRRAQQTLEH